MLIYKEHMAAIMRLHERYKAAAAVGSIHEALWANDVDVRAKCI